MELTPLVDLNLIACYNGGDEAELPIGYFMMGVLSILLSLILISAAMETTAIG